MTNFEEFKTDILFKDNVNFFLGHKKFNLPQNALMNYHWLNNMFGNGEIGTPKKVLENNLNFYLTNISRSKLRKLIISMEKLEQYYTKNIVFIEDEYTILLEKFLHNGPNEEIDKFIIRPDYLTCKKCKNIFFEPPPEKELLPHCLISLINSGYKVCSFCGVSFTGGESKIKICCRNECIHDFDYV